MKNYILRVDDINRYMCSKELFMLEKLSRIMKANLMIAVVPFCTDKKLLSNNSIEHDDDYWEILRSCQSQGSAIGLHGYNHQLRTVRWWKQIFPISEKAELLNENVNEMSSKICAGRKELEKNGLVVRFYAPPAHGINHNLVQALKNNDIRVISEGFFMGVRKWKGMCWIPLKCWKMNSLSLGNFSTVCLHLYTKASQSVVTQVSTGSYQFLNYEDVCNTAKELNIGDAISYFIYYLYFVRKHIMLKWNFWKRG